MQMNILDNRPYPNWGNANEIGCSHGGEDKIVMDYLNNFGIKHGLVVDIGAADGVTGSNSKRFIDWGWAAILIEPNPVFYTYLTQLYEDCGRIKIYPYAISNESGQQDFYVLDDCNIGSSSLNKPLEYHYKLQVDVKSIKDILNTEFYRRYNHIDFLSIDSEGNDLVILASFPWIIDRPSVICVEGGVGCEPKMLLLENKGYRLLKQTHCNLIYVSV
jgi:FkbM family methyltransferase